jgi:hypothetical protein
MTIASKIIAECSQFKNHTENSNSQAIDLYVSKVRHQRLTAGDTFTAT